MAQKNHMDVKHCEQTDINAKAKRKKKKEKKKSQMNNQTKYAKDILEIV